MIARYLTLTILAIAPAAMQASSIQYTFGAYEFIAPHFLPSLTPDPDNFSFTVARESMSQCPGCAGTARYQFSGLFINQTQAFAYFYDTQGQDPVMVTFQGTYPTSFLSSFGSLQTANYGPMLVETSELAPTFMPEPATYGIMSVALILLYGVHKWSRYRWSAE